MATKTKKRPAKKRITKTKKPKIETVEDPAESAAGEVVKAVADKINAGEFDSENVTVTAEVSEGEPRPTEAEGQSSTETGTPAAGPTGGDVVEKLDKINHWVMDLESAELAVAQAEGVLDGLKKEVKEAKTAFDAKVANLRFLIRNRRNGQQPLPFKDDYVEGAGEGEGKPATTAAAPQPEAWRAVLLEKLDLAGGIVQKLYDANIETMGQLADYTLPQNGNKRLTDIAGIGQAAVEKIEEATSAFWAKYTPPEETPPAAEAATDVATDSNDGEATEGTESTAAETDAGDEQPVDGEFTEIDDEDEDDE